MVTDMNGTIDLTSYFHPLKQSAIDFANYKGGKKTHPKQEPRYKVASIITEEGARELYKHFDAINTNRNEIQVIDVQTRKPIVISVTGVLTDRYRNLVNNHKCVTCDREILYYRIEDNAQGYHLNAYSRDHYMMTRDHIIPRSSGGPDALDNYQLMCSPCNRSKGSLPMDEFIKKREEQKFNLLHRKVVNGQSHADFSLSFEPIVSTRKGNIEFKKCPGLTASIVQTITSTKNTLSFKRVEFSELRFKFEGKDVGYLLEEEPLENYLFGDNALYGVQYFNINSLKFEALSDLLNLTDFSKFVLCESETVYRKLDGTILPLKVREESTYAFANIKNDKVIMNEFKTFVNTNPIEGVTCVSTSLDKIPYYNCDDSLPWDQYNLVAEFKQTPELYESRIKTERGVGHYRCDHLILRELIDMFLVQNPQYRYNVEETNA